MPEMEHGDDTLSTLLVKEAVSRGMQSPMREPILEAVEESEGSGSMGGSALPLAGGLLGLGVAIGYLLGSSELDTDDTPLEDIETPDALDEAIEDSDESMAEMESETDDETGDSSRLLRLGLLIVGVVGLELLRRRRSSEDEEWEPIEEFEPATSATFDDEQADEDEDETAADEDADAQADEEIEE